VVKTSPLLRGHTVNSRIAGSNPALSAKLTFEIERVCKSFARMMELVDIMG
jgi:hypothetical protein